MKVLGDRLLIKKIDPPKTTSSLIEVVQYEQEESTYGLVLSVGNGKLRPNGKRYPCEAKVGDTVIIRPYSGAPVTVTLKKERVEVHMYQEEDVLAVVNV